MPDNNDAPVQEEMTREKWNELLKDVFGKKSIQYLPTQHAIRGIRFDFCSGLRVYFPDDISGVWTLEVYDADSRLMLQKTNIRAGDYFVARKRYYVNYAFRLFDENGKNVYNYKGLDLQGRDVFIRFPVETLGDTIAWFKGVEDFHEKHHCNLYVRIAEYLRPILEKAHPDIHFITYEQAQDIPFFAQYTIAIFHNDADSDDTPNDYRTIPLNHCSAYILGVQPSDEPPKICFPTGNPLSKNPYVTIGTQASGGVKLWHHPLGWMKTIQYLKQNGYEVYDIDRDCISGNAYLWNHIPKDAVDVSGDISLERRAEMIYHSDFFIGLGSGLSWLAWAVGKPIVLIGGFSESWEEFRGAYRVYNPHVCHGCFNSVAHVFNHKDYFWCPKHQNTPRHWECSVGITPELAIKTIATIPVFAEHVKQQNNKSNSKTKRK